MSLSRANYLNSLVINANIFFFWQIYVAFKITTFNTRKPSLLNTSMCLRLQCQTSDPFKQTIINLVTQIVVNRTKFKQSDHFFSLLLHILVCIFLYQEYIPICVYTDLQKKIHSMIVKNPRKLLSHKQDCESVEFILLINSESSRVACL